MTDDMDFKPGDLVVTQVEWNYGPGVFSRCKVTVDLEHINAYKAGLKVYTEDLTRLEHLNPRFPNPYGDFDECRVLGYLLKYVKHYFRVYHKHPQPYGDYLPYLETQTHPYITLDRYSQGALGFQNPRGETSTPRPL